MAPSGKVSDEQSLSDQDALLLGASEEKDETGNEIYVRVRGIRRLCRCIHIEGQMMSCIMQELGSAIRADVRSYNTGNMPMAVLVQ